MDLLPHHAASIDNLVRALEPDASIRALILGGSIAHGFARSDSDIDVVMVVDEAEYQRRVQSRQMHYNNRVLCTYPGGYIDGKFADTAFLRLVAERGSDPARYAFKDGRILFSRMPELPSLLEAIVRFPVEQKAARMDSFSSQLLAWRWYYSEGLRQQSAYLTMLALQKIALFTCRLVLTANELLFPFHKWMLRVTAAANHQPANLVARLENLLTAHTWPRVDEFCAEVLAFYGIDFATADTTWPSRFMKDTELAWITGHPSVDDQ